nr:uncharacterized protein LOC109192810 [Ipomoea batatas]
MGMYVLPLEDNLFLFQFPHSKDMQWVFYDGPWLFENNLLVCKQVMVGLKLEDVVLDSVDFWIQALSVKFNRWVQGGSCLSFPLVQKGPSTSGHKATPLDPLGSGGDRGK